MHSRFLDIKNSIGRRLVPYGTVHKGIISVNSEPLDPVAEFPYLGHMVTYNNSDWLILYQNLWKVCSQLYIVVNVVLKTWETVQARCMLYKAVLQLVF